MLGIAPEKLRSYAQLGHIPHALDESGTYSFLETEVTSFAQKLAQSPNKRRAPAEDPFMAEMFYDPDMDELAAMGLVA